MLRKAWIIRILIVISTVFIIPIQNIYWDDGWVSSNNWSFKIFSENDELILQNLIIRFQKNGFYKIYVEDMDWNESRIQINVDWIGTNDWHWSSEKKLDSNTNKNLNITISPTDPYTSDWINLTIKTHNNYVGNIIFSKLEYRSSTYSSWYDISGSYDTYISEYSDDWKIWYYKISTYDKGEVTLNNLIKFKQVGFYRIHIEDDNWNEEIQEIFVNAETWRNPTEETVNESQWEIYESRSCEKYRIEFNNELSAYTSPDLKTTEYFINSDYLKRYIDSKNAQNIACNKNKSWVSSPYIDNNTNTKYVVAPNGKVYFITQTNWWYSSSQLKSWITFSSIDELRAYVNKYNSFTEMSL